MNYRIPLDYTVLSNLKTSFSGASIALRSKYADRYLGRLQLTLQSAVQFWRQ